MLTFNIASGCGRSMKTMKCKNLGGPADCDHEFKGETFDEISGQSKKHAMDNIDTHSEAMMKMKKMMEKDPDGAKKWYEDKKKEFEAL